MGKNIKKKDPQSRILQLLRGAEKSGKRKKSGIELIGVRIAKK